MIRFAFIAVTVLAGLLAYGGFALVSRGGSAPERTTQAAAPVEEPSETPDVVPEENRLLFLADQDLSVGPAALILYGMGPDGQDMVVTDLTALQSAAGDAYVVADAGDISAQAGETTPVERRIASLFVGDALRFHLSCAAAPCTASENSNLAGLLDAAQPLIRIENSFDDYTSYLDAVSFVNSDPDFAFLGLTPDVGGQHPMAQQTPQVTLALPTISRVADQPLDIATHGALLSALVLETLPDGGAVETVTITDLGQAIVMDADNSRPATRGGQPIPFPDARFYQPTVVLSGVIDLPDDTLERLSEDTRLRVDWADAARDFVATLGLDCTDCFAVDLPADTYDAATIIGQTPERYDLSYYDLREAP